MVVPVQDYDETYPPFRTEAAWKPGELAYTTWDLLLQTSVKNYGVSRCPSDPSPAVFDFKDGSTIWRSYGVPRNIIWVPTKGLSFPRSAATVPQPADTLLMGEKIRALASTAGHTPRPARRGTRGISALHSRTGSISRGSGTVTGWWRCSRTDT